MIMKNLTFRQLKYFEALVEQGHFGRAAEVCAISQPALSVQIKDLEEDVGSALFERSARRVRLTTFGEDFAKRVRVILQGLDELGEFARLSQTGGAKRIKLGVIPTIAPYLLPALIKNLGENHAGTEIDIRESITPRLIKELTIGRLDAAIVALPISEPTFEETPLFCEDLLLVRPEQDRDEPPMDPENLSDQRVLLLEEGHCFRDQTLSYCNLGTATQREGLEGTSLTTLVQMVGAGIGVTLIPEMAQKVETRSAPVCVSRFTGTQPSRTVGIIWRKSNPIAQHLKEIAAEIQKTAGY
jgi:LysR family hydrogen peroxide-inducible transcriptional activator